MGCHDKRSRRDETHDWTTYSHVLLFTVSIVQKRKRDKGTVRPLIGFSRARRENMTPLMVLQMVVVVVGTAWCIALASTALFGGWYAQTHPTTGNDRVMRQVTRFLWFLTFGLTDAPLPNQQGEGARREAEKEQDVPAR
jgi:hypothetical protein